MRKFDTNKLVRTGAVAAGAVLLGLAAFGIYRWQVRRAQVAANRTELARLGLPGDGTKDFMPLPAILPHSAGAARLGEDLFADKRLARTSRRTCTSCHWLNMGGSDGKIHGRFMTRPIVNAAATTRFLHDGSLTNFTDAARLMLTDGTYAGGGSLDEIVARLAADPQLVAGFARVYPAGLTGENLLDALEQYGRTLLSAGRPFDRFQGGDDHALDEQAKAGFALFRSKNCLACHQGPVLGGHKVYENRKVTPLRGIGLRRVFLSDASAGDIATALSRMPSGDRECTADERAALTAFLKTL